MLKFTSLFILSVVAGACARTQVADIPVGSMPNLRQEILRMVENDQAVQRQMMEKSQSGRPLDAADEARRDSVFDLNLDRMRDVFETHGWPGYELVGEDGSHGAWLLLQHADRDTTLQRTALELLTQAVESGKASGKDLAYLMDRVRVAEGRLQVYGTQLQYDERACPLPTPTEDQATLDERRATVGLPPIATYLDEVVEALGRSATCGRSGQ